MLNKKECPKCGVKCLYGAKAVSGHQLMKFSWFKGYECIFCRIEFK